MRLRFWSCLMLMTLVPPLVKDHLGWSGLQHSTIIRSQPGQLINCSYPGRRRFAPQSDSTAATVPRDNRLPDFQ